MSESKEQISGPDTATLIELPRLVYEYLEGTGWGQGEFDGDPELMEAHTCLTRGLTYTREGIFSKATPAALTVFREYVETLACIGDEDERSAAENFLSDTQEG
ncbi:hypothetical protein ACI2L4_25060 [Streptomyces sparsogenes]|uniref:hypothetical protein n=1 Tax=Streptomyces sparsogenes TaxID=67365 RepID=UPI00384E015F